MTTPDNIQQFDFDINLLQAILWQYDSAVNLQGILEAKNQWYIDNQSEFWQDWYTNVFNLNTADQFGLVVWGLILGFQLYVNTPPVITDPIFGFKDSGGVNFDHGILGNRNGQTILLPVEIQRIALKLRYFQLTGSGTVPEINRIMKYVFGNQGLAYVVDQGHMSQEYVFTFPLSADLKYLFDNYDVLPRPAGVQSTYINTLTKYFGFNSFNFNFDNGILFEGP